MKGLILITVSAASFASYGIWSRLIGDDLGHFTQAWVRGVLLVSCLLLYITSRKALRARSHLANKFTIIPSQNDLGWLLLISLCGGLNQAPYFFAFQKLPVGTATLLFYAGLLIGGIGVGVTVLGERLSGTKWTAIALASAGLLVLHPLFITRDHLTAALAAGLAGIMGGIEIAATKKVSQRYSITYILIMIYSVQIVGNAGLAAASGETVFIHILQPQTLLGIAGYTAAMMLAMISVVTGFRHTTATIGSIIGLTEVLFAIAYGAVLFEEPVTRSMVIGTVCILLAAGLSVREA